MAIVGIFVALLFALIPIAVITVIVVAIVKHNKNDNAEKEHSDFEKIVRAIYVYLILISLLCAIIGGTIYLFNSTMNYLMPEKNYDNYSSYNSEERKKNQAIVGIYTASSILVATVPLFIYHSKIAKMEIRKKES